jgi:proteic killer suppression protein
MIRSFKDAEAAKIYARQRSKKLPTDIQQIALRKMRMLNNAINLNDPKNGSYPAAVAGNAG